MIHLEFLFIIINISLLLLLSSSSGILLLLLLFVEKKKNNYYAFILKIASCFYSCRRLSTFFFFPNCLFRSFCPVVVCYRPLALWPTDFHSISLYLTLPYH